MKHRFSFLAIPVGEDIFSTKNSGSVF